MSEMQKDLVLSINEYAYVLDETKGHVVCWVGPSKTSLSNSDKLVRFDTRSKSFVKRGYSEVVNLFATAPENWYIILKNPVEGNKHPAPGATYTDYIKAKDVAQACKKLHKQVNDPGLIIKKIEVFTNEG